MSCLAIIQSARNEMSANEKKLADFILNNSSLIRDYSSQQLAGSVGVSQSSVVKFSQKMGYKGFTDLKLAIHESVVKQESNVAVLSGGRRAARRAGESLKDRLFEAKTDAISGATELNGDAELRLAARAIESAARVLLVGTGSAFTVVRDIAMKLASIGKPVIAEPDANVQLQSVGALTCGDCLIVISSSGQPAHLRQLARQAKKTGATIISLTSQLANPIATLADIRLYSATPRPDDAVSLMVASTSQQHVMDLVFLSLGRAAKYGGVKARSKSVD